MTGYQILLLLFCAVFYFHVGYAVPIADGLDDIPHQMGSLPGFAVFLISAAVILLLGYVVIGCVCCPNHNIKALSYQNGFPVSRLNDNSLQFENPSEFAIFPPHSAVIDLQPVGLPYPTFEDKVTFEPLPDILPRKLSGQSAACSSRPAHFRALLKNKVSLHDWFDDPNSNFPRDQLQYIQELGCGWFGRVVEGEAAHISNSEEKTPVLVKILREEASPSEHLHFLHEVRPFRDLSQPNVVRLLGRCLESDPFLLLMEHSTSDLKTFLVQHENKDSFVQNGVPLQMACNIAAGLKCLHENSYTHMDLAAHNCFVCKDFTVKVGDYGISFDKCREDYYCLGGIALPIRWCSPETLLCTEATIETKEITKEANVWAFGVILWEIFELGKLPYEEWSNEEVLQKVLIEKAVQLSSPSREFPLKEELYLIMKECWKPAHLRPSMEKVEKFLTRLYNDRHNLKTLETSFEERWNSLPPKIVDTKHLGTELVPLKFENDFSEKSDSHNYSSEGERFSSFEMSYDMGSKSIGSHLSPSLRVLNGSIDELTENDVCLNSVSLGGEKSMTDAVSVDSDVAQLDDDQGRDSVDLVIASNKSSQKLQAKKSVNPFIPDDAKTLPNLNMLKTLDDNSNELRLDSETLDRGHAEEEAEVMSVENSPDSVNANRVLDFCKEKSEVTHVISAPEAFSDDMVQTKSSVHVNDGISPIPDIIVHESASAVDSSHDENENMIQNCSSQVTYSESSRPFRFVFKDESVPSGDKKARSSEDSPNTTDSSLEKISGDLKSRLRSQRLTSTPLKSDHDINLNYSSSFADDEDSANVFYENIRDAENSSPVTEEYFSGSCDILDSCQLGNSYDIGAKNSDASFYCETTSKTEPTVQTGPNICSLKESTVSVGFTSALSTFEEKDDESVPKVSDSNDTAAVSQINNSTVPDNQTVVVSIPLPAFNSETNDHQHLDAFEISPEKNNLHKSDQEVDFGEPVTPEVSFNVSSCSYGNDFRSMSTDSPGVSSSNYDSPVKKYDPNVGAGLSTTPDCLVRDVKHADSGTTQDFRTLDSEASGSEYLESFSPDLTPDSFGHSDEKRMESVDNMRPVRSNLQNASAVTKTDLFYEEDDIENDSESDTNAYKRKSELRLHPYDEVIVEDLTTGEQTIITESFSACDDYDNSADSDDILKINIETDEAIIVDSSDGLVGFVPSRSIELLQECEMIPTLNPSFTVEDEKESEDSNHFDASNSASSSPVAMQSANSPCESPESTYPLHQPYRNFSLQNEVIEEEITDEIATPSSIRSSASFSSNEEEEEKMSQSSESYDREVCETSVLPSVDHFYDESNDGSRSDVSNSADCSPVHSEDGVMNNIRYVIKDYESNRVSRDLQDVMYSKQPTQAICWHSDETLDIERESPVILEGREILAGGILETRGMSVKDITATLNQLDAEDRLNRRSLNHLSISNSPSPYSSLESSPCREAYTPDFESDSDDGGTSCSSTSGSFECIHNKFKDVADISKVGDESEPSDSSREQSPKKIFSKTWDCHATPSKSALVTPEKKFNSLRKSVSFHEEDPQVVFEYPPASDSSEDDHVQEEVTPQGIAYHIFADWELHAPENEEPEIEEVLEIEELESEPYVRRPTYGIGASLGPMNRPMYSFTSGFSDDDMDLSEPMAMPSKSIVPSNSPEEGKQPSLSGDQIGELIRNQLNNLALEESRLKWMQDELDQQSHEFSCLQHSDEQEVKLADLLIDFEAEMNSSPPTDSPGYKLQADGFPVLENKANFLDLELIHDSSFDARDAADASLPDFLTLDAFLSKEPSDSGVKFDYFSDDSVPSAADMEGSESAPLIFVEGNERPISAKNRLNSNRDPVFSKDQASHLMHEIALDSGPVNLEKMTDDEMKGNGSVSEGDLKVNINSCADALSRSADILNSGSSQSRNSETSERTVNGELSDKNVSKSENGCVSLAENTTGREDDNASEKGPRDSRLIENLVESFLPLCEKQVKEEPSDTTGLELDIGTEHLASSSDVIVKGNSKSDPDQNYVDNSHDLLSSRVEEENIFQESKNSPSSKEKEMNANNELPKAMQSDLLDKNKPCDEENLHVDETNLLATDLKVGEVSALKCTDLTEATELNGNSKFYPDNNSVDNSHDLFFSEVMGETNENIFGNHIEDGQSTGIEMNGNSELSKVVDSLDKNQLEDNLHVNDTNLTATSLNGNSEISKAAYLLDEIQLEESDLEDSLHVNETHLPATNLNGNSELSLAVDLFDKKRLDDNLHANETSLPATSINGNSELSKAVDWLDKNQLQDNLHVNDTNLTATSLNGNSELSEAIDLLDKNQLEDNLHVNETRLPATSINGNSELSEVVDLIDKNQLQDNLHANETVLSATSLNGNSELSEAVDWLDKNQLEDNLHANKTGLSATSLNGNSELSEAIDLYDKNQLQDNLHANETVLSATSLNGNSELSKAVDLLDKNQLEDNLHVNETSLPATSLNGNSELSKAVDWLNKNQLDETNIPAASLNVGKASALNCTDLTKTLGAATAAKKTPQIIVTPASESEVEDELEEYLRDQLEFFHGPSVTEGEDFSVTSQFSVRPFEDVFGSHTVSHNSGDYIEAFNFEFDSGDFFEDFVDDYPNRRAPLENGNYQWWESPDVPPMIEKSSEEEDSASKPETSPLCYSSKDATHL